MIAATIESYPLSPLQQGMLFHALAHPHSGVDIEQVVIAMPTVDLPRLQAAWDRVIARHAVLRTAFCWEGPAPLQSVAGTVDVPFAVSEYPGDSDFAEWLQDDRRRGFAMDRPPLMRLRLFRIGNQEFRLVWTFHHALLDGRSITLVLDELFELYDHSTAPLTGCPRPYRDYIEWLELQNCDAGEVFWRNALAGFTAPTPLTVTNLPGDPGGRGQGDHETVLSIDATRALSQFADEIGVTMNTLVQAAWAIVLGRYSGEDEVCFGATRACRKSSIDGAEGIVGLLINTVPVRVTIPKDGPLIPFLLGIREQWIAIRPHEHTPLSKIQAWSGIPPGESLFQSLVVFENYDLTTHFHSRGTAWSSRSIRLYEQTNYPLCIAAYGGSTLRIVAEFDRSHFSHATVARLLGHLRTVLTHFPQHRGLVADVPILTPSEHAELLTPARPAREFHTPQKTLHTLFTEQAAKSPDAIAVKQGSARITYAELDRAADCIAGNLIAAGARAGTIIGLFMERSPALVTSILAILKTGAAYLPIDPATPPDRLAFMLEDAKATVLLTQLSLRDHVPPEQATTILCVEQIDRAATLLKRPSEEPDSLCYVIYTSGSTGQPKGCCISHRNVVRLFAATQHWFHFDAHDVWTLFHSVAFDFSVWELWGALLHGGTLVVVPFEISRSPAQFHELLITERITVLNQTPSAFRQLIAVDAESHAINALSLRSIILGGEALEMRILQPWFERHGDTRPQVVNMYGITETTVHVTYRPLTAIDTESGSVIGEPIPDLKVYILDSRQHPVPIGVPGELHIGGDGLARNYLNRPELTAERFIQNPFAPSERLYRSGDLARWLPGRDIEYLGRIDQQVKIRGFRIELGEIETVLCRHPQIAQAVVLAVNTAAEHKQLVAWFIAKAGSPLSAPSLRRHVSQFLPDYMIPAAFVPIDRIPLTRNGKLDKKALPSPSGARAESGDKFVAPRNEREERIATVWQRVLKLERVGIHDNFFELGGDSILSILVVSQCRQAGIALTPRQVFEHPTIAGLASLAEPTVPVIAEREPVGPVPLTPIQQWFFAQDFEDSHHWNQSFVFALTPAVTDEQLQAAFASIIAAHPAFALQFKRTPQGWTQSFRPADPSIDGSSLRCMDAVSPEDVRIQSSFSLDGPLLRYARTGNHLTISVHHLIIDGVSWGILLSDLDAVLRGSVLPPSSTGFHTWAHALEVASESPAIRAEIPYWKMECAGSHANLPRDFHGGTNVESDTDTVTISFGENETAALLRELPARGIRIHDGLLTALAHGLSSWTQSADITIDIEGHGREESAFQALTAQSANLSRTIGWFTTIFPFTLRTEASVMTTLKHTSDALRAVPRNGFGFMPLRRAGLVPQSNAEVLFNFLGLFDQVFAGLEAIKLAPHGTAPWRAPGSRRTHLIEINALVANARLEIHWIFNRKIHSRESILRAGDVFSATLRELLQNATRPRFELAQCDVAAVLRRFPNATDIHPLSPMQRLFHALETARPGSGNDQWNARIIGLIDLPRLKAAWQATINRHTALHSAYIAEDVPHTVVVPDAVPEWRTEDWRMFSTEERGLRLEAYLSSDLVRPFDLARPPLTRLALFQVADDEHWFVWTHHHLEIDGWSWPLLFKDVSAFYARETLPPCRPFRDYIGWLAARDTSSDETYWREYLRGFSIPTPLPLLRGRGNPGRTVEVTLRTAPITELSRHLKVTSSALVHSAWALILSHHSGHRDVMFGTAVAGRPTELPGSSEIVGHFVNNLPFRADVGLEETFAGLAGRMHREFAQLTSHQHTALQDIQSWSELPWNARMFKTLVVFQNYVTPESAMRIGEANVTDLRAPVRTAYPLTLVVTPDSSLSLTLIASPSTASVEDATDLLSQLAQVLVAVSQTPDIPIEQLGRLLPPPVAEGGAEGSTISIHPGVSPETATERVIAGIWQSAFGREISITDNFFDIGGHSLLMLQLHKRLETELGRHIPIVKLFEHPSIRAIARFIAGNTPESTTIADARDRGARARAMLAKRKPNRIEK